MNSNFAKKSMTVLLAASILSGSTLGVASMAVAQTSSYSSTDTSAPVMDAFQKEIFDLTNQHRINHGLAPLKWSNSITQVAQNWTNYQLENNQWKHNPNYYNEIPAGWDTAGENIAANESAEAVFYSWVNSEGHNANLLNPQNTTMGLGYGLQTNSSYEYAGMYYVTQNLAGYAGDRDSTPVEPAPVEEEPVTEPTPVEPEPTTPAEPEPTTPAEPEPTTPAEPEPTTPAEPEPTTPAEPEPTTPAEPEPTTPAEPEPTTPAEPEPTTPAEPAPTTPAEPEPTQPSEPAPSDEPINFTDENQGSLEGTQTGEWQIVVSNLQPNTAYDFVLFSDPTEIGTLTTDANGSVTVDIPNTVATGVHHLAVYPAGSIAADELGQEDMVGWAAFEVDATEAPVDGTNPNIIVDVPAPTVGGNTPVAPVVTATDTNGNGVIEEDELGNTAVTDETSKNLGLGAIFSFMMAAGLFIARSGKAVLRRH